MAEISEEQRALRALKRQRTRALAAETERERFEARHREWAVNGTQLTREELEAGKPCRGCGLPIIDGRGSWPALLELGPEERAEYEVAEAGHRARHVDCRASRWSVAGSHATHCSDCCPPPPLSDAQVARLASVLSQKVDPQDLASWRLVLTCDHVTEQTQHRTHDRWTSSVIECAVCQRHRGVVTADLVSTRQPGSSGKR